MWRQHQNLVGQLPHLARIPHVLCPFSEMHMGDICAWSTPADPHQLQSAFRPGGSRMQVSRAASLSSSGADMRKTTHYEDHLKGKNLTHFSTLKKWVSDRMELQK